MFSDIVNAGADHANVPLSHRTTLTLGWMGLLLSRRMCVTATLDTWALFPGAVLARWLVTPAVQHSHASHCLVNAINQFAGMV